MVMRALSIASTGMRDLPEPTLADMHARETAIDMTPRRATTLVLRDVVTLEACA
eukprot:m.129308 g.129308  ORF g.129308 m.129308 type:complete len:54 (+) comp9429_c0_seq1:1019-1180(+)